MINYLMKNHNIGYSYASNKLNKCKKNSFSNINGTKKNTINKNPSSKNIYGNNLKNVISPKNEKRQIKCKKNILNELFKKKETSPEETIVKKNNKTNTNSPIKKISYKKYLSLKKFNQKKTDNFRLYLNNKYNDYISQIKNNIINNNTSLSNNTNITNITNNITTNFTNSINNTAGSITNNNSNNISNKKKHIKINEKQQKEIKINIKILYKDIFYKIELNQFNNGLWLAKKINENLNLCLNEKQIHHLAEELTNQINNVINYIVYFRDVKNYGVVIDINKIIEECNDKKKRYKIIVKYNHRSYYFFINNNKEDINDMVNIIINNIIKNEKYESSALRDEIIKKINFSFDKTYKRNQLLTDINNNVFEL